MAVEKPTTATTPTHHACSMSSPACDNTCLRHHQLPVLSPHCDITCLCHRMPATTPQQWSTMECIIQPAAWTMIQNFLMVSHAKTFPRTPANCGHTLHRAEHLESGEIWCHHCLHLAFRKCSGISWHSYKPLSMCCMPINHNLHPCYHPTHHSYD